MPYVGIGHGNFSLAATPPPPPPPTGNKVFEAEKPRFYATAAQLDGSLPGIDGEPGTVHTVGPSGDYSSLRNAVLAIRAGTITAPATVLLDNTVDHVAENNGVDLGGSNPITGTGTLAFATSDYANAIFARGRRMQGRNATDAAACARIYSQESSGEQWVLLMPPIADVKFFGLAFYGDNTQTFSHSAPVDIGNHAQAARPARITFDHCIGRGPGYETTRTDDMRRFGKWSCNYFGMIDCWVGDIEGNSESNGAIVAGGKGHTYVNCHFEGAQEAIIHGGFRPSNQSDDGIPHDLAYIGCLFTMDENALRLPGVPNIVGRKNSPEIKFGRRIYFLHCVFEHTDATAQSGFCVNIKVSNQSTNKPAQAWLTTTDVIFDACWLRNSTSGFTFLGSTTANKVGGVNNVSMRDVVISGLGHPTWAYSRNGPGSAAKAVFLQLLNNLDTSGNPSLQDFQMDGVTCIANPNHTVRFMRVESTDPARALGGFRMTNCIFPSINQDYEVIGGPTNFEGDLAIDDYTTTDRNIDGNIVVGPGAKPNQYADASRHWAYCASTDDVRFTNPDPASQSIEDFRLLPSSPGYGTGVQGRTHRGTDIDRLLNGGNGIYEAIDGSYTWDGEPL